MIRGVLGSRASIGGVLGSGRGGAAAAWYLAGGVSAANCVAAYQPIGAASLAASYVNLATPGTYNAAAPVAAPTFAAATGWKFNGSTQYLTTGVVPASNQTWSVLARFSGGSTVTGALLGSGTPYFFLWDAANVAGLGAWYGSGGGLLFVTPNLTSGVLGFAGNVGYRNGTAEFGTMTAPSGTATRDIWIGGWNNGSGSPVNASNRYIQAVAIYNTVLSSTQVGLISTAMAAL